MTDILAFLRDEHAVLLIVGVVSVATAIIGRLDAKGVKVDLSSWSRWLLALFGVVCLAFLASWRVPSWTDKWVGTWGVIEYWAPGQSSASSRDGCVVLERSWPHELRGYYWLYDESVAVQGTLRDIAVGDGQQVTRMRRMALLPLRSLLAHGRTKAREWVASNSPSFAVTERSRAVSARVRKSPGGSGT